METKSVLQSKRSWFNYGSIIALGITALIADEQFSAVIKETLGMKGVIGMMVVGAMVNQYLAQTSTYRPTFELPKKKPTHADRLDMLDPAKQADDNYASNLTKDV